jgi:hypothetical protein
VHYRSIYSDRLTDLHGWRKCGKLSGTSSVLNRAVDCKVIADVLTESFRISVLDACVF